jgi:superoxide dismutase, Fe-Mn family
LDACGDVNLQLGKTTEKTMSIELPKLPYSSNALEPHITAATLDIHHGKHHRAYVEKTKLLIAGTALVERSLDDILSFAASKKRRTTLFNNAAQAWNHAFYWSSMSPEGGGEPRGSLADRIEADYGSFAHFREAFKSAAVRHFGSGWVWLVLTRNRLEIVSTSNADTPIAHGKAPLLTMDVWEHAYYLDYQNRRAEYAANFVEKLANWEFAASNFQCAARRSTAEPGNRPHDHFLRIDHEG